MGILSGLNIKNLSLTDPKAWDISLWNLYGSQSLSGETVTESSALTLSAVWCAVNLYASTISTLPLHLLRKKQNKTLQAKEQRIYRVLHDEFNPYMTAENGRAVLMAHILTWGNCYAEKVYNGMGELVEIYPISPNRVRLEMVDGVLIYHIRVDREEKPFTRDKILHIPGLGFDGFMGYSVIAMARKSLGLAMAMETFGSKYFGEGTHPSGIVTHPNAIQNPNLRKALQESYAGLGKSHRLMLLEEGMDYKSVGIPPEDSQFLESRQFQIPEVARWFNLPPHKLKDLTRSSFNNIESEQISFVTDSILPWLIRLEQNYGLQLLSPLQKKDGFYFHHNVEGLLRGSAKDRAEYFRIMRNIGAMSPNDIREKEDLDPIPNGDKYFVQANEIPMDLVTDFWKKQIESDNLQRQLDDEKQARKNAERGQKDAEKKAFESEKNKIRAEEERERERQIKEIETRERMKAEERGQQAKKEKFEAEERERQANKEKHEAEKARIKAEEQADKERINKDIEIQNRLRAEDESRQAREEKANFEKMISDTREKFLARVDKTLIKINEYLDRQNGETKDKEDNQNVLQVQKGQKEKVNK